ncbi:class I SAM-dependent methyltransferase [Aliarcobacter butzleri]
MKNKIINKINESELYVSINDIFIQDKDSISFYEINKKEQEAMDNVVKKTKSNNLNKLEEYYNNYMEMKIVEKNVNLINTIKFISSSIAIDCGCGKGVYLKTLSNKFDLVIAIDLSMEAILYAKRTNQDLDNVIYINGSMLDFYNIFNESIADFCLSSEVIEHVPYPDIYLENIYNLLKQNGSLLISTPCQNLYFYPFQFFSMLFTKPKTLIKLLNPLGNWQFALDWHPAMSKKSFLNLLNNHKLELLYYQNFIPYYFDKFPMIYYVSMILPAKNSLSFYKYFLNKYNTFIEKISFGIRQHALMKKS